ncbi:hypothetical protein ACSS6W_006566 [Trichoderma asperelloides]
MFFRIPSADLAMIFLFSRTFYRFHHVRLLFHYCFYSYCFLSVLLLFGIISTAFATATVFTADALCYRY